MTRLLALLLLALPLLALLAACDQSPLPTVGTSPGPDDPAAPSARRPYRSVMAGTADHGVGERP
jgi:hypothetical protein